MAVDPGFGDCTVLFFDLSFDVSFTHPIKNGGKMTIELNQPAPDFQLSDQDGKLHKLADYRGKRVVLYFYPKG